MTPIVRQVFISAVQQRQRVQVVCPLLELDIDIGNCLSCRHYHGLEIPPDGCCGVRCGHSVSVRRAGQSSG